MPRVDQLQPPLQRFHGVVKNAQLSIKLPQREIISRQLRGDHEPNIFQVRRARLVGSLGRFDAPSAPAE